MPSEGPNNPNGASSTEFTDPNNAKTDNGLYASAAETVSLNTNQINLYDFGFSIPGGDTIDGVELSIERRASHNSGSIYVTDDDVLLMTGAPGSPVTIGDDQASGDQWPTSDAVKTYGGPSDTWGAALTPAIVNASDFGIWFNVQHITDGTSVTAYVDYLELTIYHSTPGGGSGSQSASFLLSMIGTP